MDTHIKGPAVNGHGALTALRGLQTLFGKATGTLTSDNTNVANNDTVTIGTKVYTFKTALTPAEGEVLIGANADASLLNLIHAINHTGVPGTDYQVAVADPNVTAAASVTAHAFLVTAIKDGVAGNGIPTTETSAHLSWGAAVTGGALGNTTPAGDRVLLKTNGASFTQPLLVELNEIQITAFDGTSPVVSIVSQNLDGSGEVIEFAIGDIVSKGAFQTRIITVDKKYLVRYTPATGSPTAGDIWSLARVNGMGSV